jgi:hypothetical protein
MPKIEPMLRIDASKRGHPRCSVCKQEFGNEGLAKDLIEAFARHVRRQHLGQEPSRIGVRIVTETEQRLI